MAQAAVCRSPRRACRRGKRLQPVDLLLKKLVVQRDAADLALVSLLLQFSPDVGEFQAALTSRGDRSRGPARARGRAFSSVSVPLGASSRRSDGCGTMMTGRATQPQRSRRSAGAESAAAWNLGRGTPTLAVDRTGGPACRPSCLGHGDLVVRSWLLGRVASIPAHPRKRLALPIPGSNPQAQRGPAASSTHCAHIGP